MLTYIRLAGYTLIMKELTSALQSLSEETRVRILSLLLNKKELCVCDIMAALQIPQSTASRNLSYLKNAGWIIDRKEAVWVHYSISKQLSPLQQSLLPTLRHFLYDNSIANEDMARLSVFYNNKNCCG